MPKKENPKDVALRLFKTLGHEGLRELVYELNRLLELSTVTVYYAGSVGEEDKEKISRWAGSKITGDYQVKYVPDSSLIAGFKIIYKDFIYDASVLNSFKSQTWKQQSNQN